MPKKKARRKPKRFSSYGEIKDPIRKVLQLFCTHAPPKFVRGHDYSNLTDEQHQELQGWVSTHLRLSIEWSTAIGIIEAAETIVAEAVTNANIPPAERTT